MIHVGIQLDDYQRGDGTNCVRLLLSGRGTAKIRIVNIPKTHWDAVTKSVKRGYDSRGKEQLNSIIRNERVKLEDYIRSIDADRWGYTCAQVKKMYLRAGKSDSLIQFYDREIDRLKKLDRDGLARSRKETLSKLRAFRENISFREITYEFIQSFDDWMKIGGMGVNGRSKHLRDLRAVINQADKMGVEVSYPFKKFRIPKETTKKRAISIDQLKVIADKKLSGLDKYARDMFIFSFYTGGMSFIDIYRLDKKSIQGGYITYKRKKLGVTDGIIVTTIIPERATDFLKQIRAPGSYNHYKKNQYRINLRLKKLGVTMHVARHTWIMIAKSLGYSEQILKEIVGHKSSSGSMQHYDSGFDQSVKDECVLHVASLLDNYALKEE